MSVHEHCPHTTCCYFIIHRDQRRLYANRACVSSVSMSVSFCNWVDVCTQPSPETLISYVHCACGSSVVNHTWSSPAPCADNIWAVNRWNNILDPSANKSEATVILAIRRPSLDKMKPCRMPPQWNSVHLAAGAPEPEVDPDVITVYNMRFEKQTSNTEIYPSLHNM